MTSPFTSLDVNISKKNEAVMNASSVPLSSTEPTSVPISKSDGIENTVHNQNISSNNSNNNNNNSNNNGKSSSHLSLSSFSSKSPLPPTTGRIHTKTTTQTNSIDNNANTAADEVNKLSVSFAVETTTLSFMLSDDEIDDDNEDEQDESSPHATMTTTTTTTTITTTNSRRLSGSSILDANTTTDDDDDDDDDFGKLYRRPRRQRRSVGYYKWLATNSPNEYVDMNGNPRTTTLSGNSSHLDDSIDTKSSSSEYDEEESEYVFDHDEDLDDDDVEEREEATSVIVNGEDKTMVEQPASENDPSSATNEASPSMPASPTVDAMPLLSSSTSEQVASPSSTGILSEQVAKNQIVLATPQRRSPRKRQSIMPSLSEQGQVQVQVKTYADAVKKTAPTAVQSPVPSSPARIILSEPIGHNIQRVVMTTPIRRSPRKRRPIQRDETKMAIDLLPSIAEPPQPSRMDESCNDTNRKDTSTRRATVATQDDQPESTTAGTPKKQDLTREASSTNGILSQPGGSVHRVIVTTPIRRSPRKRRSIQGDESFSAMPSIAELAPASPISAKNQQPSLSSSTEATINTNSEGNIERPSFSNEILSEQLGNLQRVITTPLRRSPRKRQSMQGNETMDFMSSIAEAALSPIAKISSPAQAVPNAKGQTSKVTKEMSSVTKTLSNATIQSPVDAEMNTPVTQSPFSSTSQANSSAKKHRIVTTPTRSSPRKKRAVEAGETECVMSPFATAELSPIKRESTSPTVATFQSPKAPFLSPQQLPPTSQSIQVQDSAECESASTSLLSQFTKLPPPPETDTSVTMDVDETIKVMNESDSSSTEQVECTTRLDQALDHGQDSVEKEEKSEEDDDGNASASKSFVLEYSLEHDDVPIDSGSVHVDESSTSPVLALVQSKCFKVRIVYDESPPPLPKSILRRKLRYTKAYGNEEVEMDKKQDDKVEHEEVDESDNTSSYGITLPELRHRMAILFPTDYSELIQSSCDSARLIACFTLYKDALFVENESITHPQQQPAKTAARARTRRRRLSLECKTPGINYLQPIMILLNELVQLELVQYQSMSMAKETSDAASNSSSSLSDDKEGSHRVHFPAFDGSALQPPSDVIVGSDRVREESIEQLTKVVMSSQSLFGSLIDAEDPPSESSATKFDVGRMAITVLQSLVHYLQTDFVTHGHAVPCSWSFPLQSHTVSRVEKAAQSYAHDLSHVLRNSRTEETPTCLTFPNPSHDVSIAYRMSQSRGCGPWECRLADTAGQQIRYWLRTLLNPIPDRAPPKSASNCAKAKQWRRRICDIVALCVEDAEQSMAVEDGSMSSLVSDALSFLHALFGASSWEDFIAEGDDGLGVPDGTNTIRGDVFFSSTISLRQNFIQEHQWNDLEDELIAATEFLAAMNGVRFLYELFSILVKEPKYYKVWKKTIQELAGTLALVDQACIQEEDVQLLLLRTPLEEILIVLEKISQQHSTKYTQCQKQLKEFSKRFAFGKKSKRKKRHQPDLSYLETAYEETMEKINFPRAMRL
ncbi:unnamed protein product [Cylindrotheca closterium]|uniref:Uncharacterized protein n=1 Tax=Cylindrotheca closterium TaxID=2856 RepID=A0AAD2FYY3_9STRA|nr:unnamed protein product [Cylindrotheca closterium]